MAWVLSQTAADLLAVHHPVERDALAALLPTGLRPHVDDEGRAWVTVLAMQMTDVHPRFLPSVPRLSSYPQVALRAFVVAPGGEAGAAFLTLAAPDRLVTWLGRVVLGLPTVRGAVTFGRRGSVRAEHLEGSWRATTVPAPAGFLAERDVLFSHRRGRLRRSAVRHETATFVLADADVRAERLLAAVGLTPTGAAVTTACEALTSHVSWSSRVR